MLPEPSNNYITNILHFSVDVGTNEPNVTAVLPGTRGAAGAYAAGVPRVEGKHEPFVRRLLDPSVVQVTLRPS